MSVSGFFKNMAILPTNMSAMFYITAKRMKIIKFQTGPNAFLNKTFMYKKL